MKATGVASSGIVHQVLTIDNYKRWSVVMENYLQGQGLWDVVQSDSEGTELEGTPDIEQGLRGDVDSASEHETQAWKMKNAQAKMKNAQALHIIQLSCGQEILDEISHFKKAREAWNHLSEKYGKKLKATPNDKQAILHYGLSQQMGLFLKARRCPHEDPSRPPGGSDSGWTKLHHAVTYGAVDVVECIVQTSNDELRKQENKKGYTALALAAHYTGNTDIAKLMVESEEGTRKGQQEIPNKEGKMVENKEGTREGQLEIPNKEGEMVESEKGTREGQLEIPNKEGEMVESEEGTREGLLAIPDKEGKMVESDEGTHKGLLEIPNKEGEIPVLLAAANGYKEMTAYLYSKTPQKVLDGDPRNRVFLLARCIAAEIFGVALKLLTSYPSLAEESLNANYSTEEILLGKRVEGVALALLTNHENPAEESLTSKYTPEEILLRKQVEGKFSVLDVLANMPSAFRSGSRFGFGQQFIYDILSVKRGFGDRYKSPNSPNIVDNVEVVTSFVADIRRRNTPFAGWSARAFCRLVLDFLRLEKLFGPLLHRIAVWFVQNFKCMNIYGPQLHRIADWFVQNFKRLYIFGPQLHRIADWFVQNFKRLDIFSPQLHRIADWFVQNFKCLNIFGIKEIYKQKYTHYEVLGILSCFCERIALFDDDLQLREALAYDATVHAAQHGIIEFIISMIQANDDLLLAVDSCDRDIFSCAILNRKQNVFQLIHYLNGVWKEIFRYRRDACGNNLLHLAAHLGPSSDLDTKSGAAFQMQREIQWFKAVEEFVHPLCKEAKNGDGQKPHELFTENHEELMEDGEKWAKKTANSFTIVGTLIATIMFAAAFTVPGGNNQGNGIPIFSHDKIFTTFLIADALSFFTSVTSVIIFIGILTSRYAENDFLKNLPWKLLSGILPLILSVCSMIVAFCAALAIILKGYPTDRWFVTGPILSLASIPIIVLVVSQLPLMFDIFHSTWKSPINISYSQE